MNNQSLDVRLRNVFDEIVDRAPEPGNTPHEGPSQGNRPGGSHQRWLAVAAVLILVAGIGGLVVLSRTSETDVALDGDVSDSSVSPPTSRGSVSPTVADRPERTTEPTLVDAPDATVTIASPPNGATVLAIGDMVMLGAAPRLTAAGVVVDAEASRGFVDGLDVVSGLVDQGRIGGPSPSIETVVLHLGGNGSINPTDLEQMMTLLSDVDVIVLTSGIDRDYAAANDDQIRRLPATYPNVSVIDWGVLRDDCVGECFYADDIHLRPAGQRFYADLLITELQTM